MSLKKTSTKRKSVTWQDISTSSTESSLSLIESAGLSSFKTRAHAMPSIIFKLHNVPVHYLAVVYYLLYVEYDQLVKYETINYVLLKALPLSYFGQLVWLSLFRAAPASAANGSTGNDSDSHSEKKRVIVPVAKSKRLDVNASLAIAATFLALLSSVPIYLVAVLLGSPVLAFQPQTYLFALHLALLVTLPLIAVYKFSAQHWVALVVRVSDYRFLLANPVFLVALASAVGAWAGVLTIPLDWDRDWQLYPISLVVGAYVGGALGGMVAFAGSFIV